MHVLSKPQPILKTGNYCLFALKSPVAHYISIVNVLQVLVKFLKLPFVQLIREYIKQFTEFFIHFSTILYLISPWLISTFCLKSYKVAVLRMQWRVNHLKSRAEYVYGCFIYYKYVHKGGWYGIMMVHQSIFKSFGW